MRYSWCQLRWWAVLALFVGLNPAICHAEPSIRLFHSDQPAILGEMYPVDIELSWEGDSGQYASLPPHVDLSEWAEVEAITTSTIEGAQHQIRHTLQIRPLKTGDFTIPDLLVPFFSPNSISEPVKGDAELAVYPTLSAGAVQLLVVESTDALVYWMGFGAFCCVLCAIVWGYSRRKAVHSVSAGYIETTIPGIMHEARKHRLDGYHYKFFQEMLRGAGLLKESAEKSQLQKEFEELTLAVGYKGMVPTEEELDGAMRDLERAHKQEQQRPSA